MHFPALLKAAEALCAQEGIEPNELEVWCDYTSIPQAAPLLAEENACAGCVINHDCIHPA